MTNFLENIEGIQKRTATVFFLIDQSGSMMGTKIGAVNHAMGETIPEMCELIKDSADANLDVAVLLFSSGARWETPKPVNVEDFHWKNIDAGNVTDLGKAFTMLNEKLSTKNGFMKKTAESFAPAFILMSDGQPTDDYKSALKTLKNNAWFRNGTKTAIAIGNDADRNVLSEFAGGMEGVIEVHNAADLAKTIKFVSVASSQIVTSCSSMAQLDNAGDKPLQVSLPDDLLDNYIDF